MKDLRTWSPATVLVIALAVIVAVVGGVVVIVHPDTLDFEKYVDVLSKAIIGAGLLAVGRGVAKHGEQVADATREAALGSPEGVGKADGFEDDE